MDNTLEKKKRRKFIISFWITTLLLGSLFFLVGIVFMLMSGVNFFPGILTFLPLIMLYWMLSWLLLNLSYRRRGTKYLLFCMGMQLIAFLVLATAFLISALAFNAHDLHRDGFYFLIFLIFISSSILVYFSVNCYRLYKLNRVDGKLWKEAIETVRNLSKTHENTPSEALIRKRFMLSFFVVMVFSLFNTFLTCFFPLMLNKQVLMSGPVAFGLGLLSVAFTYLMVYYFGYRKRGTKCLLSTIVIFVMTTVSSVFLLCMVYFRIGSNPWFPVEYYSGVTVVGWVFMIISMFLTTYFIYNCIKLYKVNFKFRKANVELVQKIVEEKKTFG